MLLRHFISSGGLAAPAIADCAAAIWKLQRKSVGGPLYDLYAARALYAAAQQTGRGMQLG
jgi:hypothetical protein